MATVWFLIALIAVSGIPAISYKGHYAYHTQEQCEKERAPLENFIVKQEIMKGNNTFYVETYCLKMEAFKDQLENYKNRLKKGIEA